MRSMDDLEDMEGVVDFYEDFAEHEAKGESDTFVRWAAGVAGDEEVLTLLRGLPTAKRQPNLVFAAARWHGAAAPAPYEALRAVLLGDWPRVRETILARATQTNEVGRCASLLPVLAGLPGPLALLEVGTSAGLCLHPDRYSYRYRDERGRELAAVDPPEGTSRVLLDCEVRGPVPLPTRLPDVVWRGGVDLNPIDVTVAEEAAWLQTLVWPEHEDRRERLAAASEVAAAGDPVDLLAADLLTGIGRVVERARAAAPGATLVIFHSAVIAYLDDGGRARWHDLATATLEAVRAEGGRAHWISNEGESVLPRVTASATCRAEATDFCLGLDGRAVGWAHGHGRRLLWC